ncbi:ABC transporter ATP-binding protein [Cohnella thailandensis]|uniref:ABC transporter ATP-binding protein n=1 Tax=Cohnella thailandensis TaxID=557557 RepID=A0A841T5E7_9BACL|nr:ABC transporter ATP-binding protein [Cohnella thailandensis]MBB6637310.1 ABC transporter ATP-binding protein [Cohnella thailandensis]MBP1976638.1 ATP-binding cassette subfamily B protein/subfamily B ATP-binding cassette protein MsbA [Cohnella thailandensis]
MEVFLVQPIKEAARLKPYFGCSREAASRRLAEEKVPAVEIAFERMSKKRGRRGRSGQLRVARWMLSFLRPYGGKLAVMIACGLAAAASEMVVPQAFQYFTDAIYPRKEAGLLAYIAAAMLIVLLLLIGASWVVTYVQRYIGERASSDMQFSVFRHLRTLGFSYYERSPSGDAITLLNHDVQRVQTFYREFLPLAFTSTLIMLISVCFLIVTSPKLSLVLIPSLLLYTLIGPYLNSKRSVLDSEWIRLQGQVGRRAYDFVSATLEFRVRGTSERRLQGMLGELGELQSVHLRHLLFAYLAFAFQLLCVFGGAALMFLYGYRLVQREELSVGEFIAFHFYFFLAVGQYMNLLSSFAQQKTVLLHASRLYGFAQQQPDIREPDVPRKMENVQGELTFRDVRFGYPGGAPILNGIDTVIRPGEKVALVGESGHGKTTLLKMIPRFYDPDEGEVLLDGAPLRELTFEQIRGAVGIVFQETYLFGGTIMDNIRFGNPEASDEEIFEAARAAMAHDFIVQLPDGYGTVVGERGAKLSGGQRQRLSIARMFVRDPKIVILDEATSALDNVSERAVQEALDRLLVGRTTVTVAHRLSTIRDYDRILYIHEGRIREEGTYEELMSRRGPFYRLAMGEPPLEEKR